MILLVALVSAVLLAVLMGGKLSGLPRLGLKGGWLMIAALVVQFYAIYFPAGKGSVQFTLASAMLICSYVLLLVAVWRNSHLPGMKVVGVGLLLNLTAILANGGYMPMSPEALIQSGLQRLNPGLELGARIAQTKDVLLLPGQTRLWFLSDIFVLSAPWPLRSVFSLGDVAIASGAFVLVQVATGAQFAAWLTSPFRFHLTRP
ncbi:MAG: DUF5317 domain-containing protein [Chloroflexi bacterium]|nr:DUF5317 domain-containing protein [Chloroflexota bacterium]